MNFILNLECNNAAFDDEMLTHEVSGILINTAKMIEKGYKDITLFDSNGNRVGVAKFQE